jgi:uncharacterized protein
MRFQHACYRYRFLTAAVIAMMLVALGSLAAAERELKPVSDADLQKIKAALPEKATVLPLKPHKVLIFWRCEGFFHEGGIRHGNKAFELMGEKTGAYSTAVSEDLAVFTPENLLQYDAIIFNNTTALKMQDEKQRAAILDFVNGGKGIVATHSAVDNFYNWPQGASMMGALFAGHPWGACGVKIDDPSHPLVKVFEGKGFQIRDEIYQMKEPYSRETLRVLLSMDMNATKGSQGRADKDNPISWIHEVGKGREFYCSLGHNNEIFWNPTILKFYLDGIQYALGDLKADATPSARLHPQPTPAPAPEK